MRAQNYIRIFSHYSSNIDPKSTENPATWRAAHMHDFGISICCAQFCADSGLVGWGYLMRRMGHAVPPRRASARGEKQGGGVAVTTGQQSPTQMSAEHRIYRTMLHLYGPSSYSGCYASPPAAMAAAAAVAVSAAATAAADNSNGSGDGGRSGGGGDGNNDALLRFRTTATAADIMWGGAYAACQVGGQSQADATIAALLQCGVRDFDTAPWYSAGMAEEALGVALEHARLKPTTAAAALEAKIHTKTGKLVVPRNVNDVRQIDQTGSATIRAGVNDFVLEMRGIIADYSAAGAWRSLEQSKARLGQFGATRIYALRLHDPDQVEGGCEQSTDPKDGMLAGLRTLRSEGEVLEVSLGICPWSSAQIKAHGFDWLHNLVCHEPLSSHSRAASDGKGRTLDTLLLAGGWNL